jgi:NAD(P)-dependent dehydrogenase (short-subunit alcohol dehydrogenase family)
LLSVGITLATPILAKTLPRGITISAGCPGWCRTGMAGDKVRQEGREQQGRTCKGKEIDQDSLTDDSLLALLILCALQASRSADEGAETILKMCIGDIQNGGYYDQDHNLLDVEKATQS